MFVRTSKFRHVFGCPAKKEFCYEGLKVTKSAHDTNFCAVNPKFVSIVVESAGGGVFLILPIEKTGRIDVTMPKVCGHRGPITDIKWCPFDDNLIASSSDDTTIKTWRIPDGGLTENLTDWEANLEGHYKKVTYIEWHPTAADILLSAAADYQCILWNTKTSAAVNIITVHRDMIFSISWNRDGSLFASTCKDKMIRVIDPRTGNIVSEGAGHQGTKASKIIFLANKGRLFTTGFSKTSERQYAIWSMSDLSKPLRMEEIDASSGLIIPFYDPDTEMIYLAGKGDGNIRYVEILADQPYVYFLSQYQTNLPQRGLGMMPKRGVDVKKCEVTRFYKLHTVKDICEPISMIVPRKSECFPSDIYPPTAGIQPSLSADQWLKGQNCDPILVPMKDGEIITTQNIQTTRNVMSSDKMADKIPTEADNRALLSNGNSFKNLKNISDNPDKFTRGPQSQIESVQSYNQAKAIKSNAAIKTENLGQYPSSTNALRSNATVHLGESQDPPPNSKVTADRNISVKTDFLSSSSSGAVPHSELFKPSNTSHESVTSSSIKSNLPFRSHSFHNADRQATQNNTSQISDNQANRATSFRNIAQPDSAGGLRRSRPNIVRRRNDEDSSSCSSTEDSGQPDSAWQENPIYSQQRRHRMRRHHHHHPETHSQAEKADSSVQPEANRKQASLSSGQLYQPPAKVDSFHCVETISNMEKNRSDAALCYQLQSRSEPNVAANAGTKLKDVLYDEPASPTADLGSRSTMIDFISVEAPDDMCITPSSLRASMNTRQRRNYVPGNTSHKDVRRTGSLQVSSNPPSTTEVGKVAQKSWTTESVLTADQAYSGHNSSRNGFRKTFQTGNNGMEESTERQVIPTSSSNSFSSNNNRMSGRYREADTKYSEISNVGQSPSHMDSSPTKGNPLSPTGKFIFTVPVEKNGGHSSAHQPSGGYRKEEPSSHSEQRNFQKKTNLSHSELLQEYFRQQQDIINLKSLVEQKDLRIRRLEEELQRVKFSESSSVVNKQR